MSLGWSLLGVATSRWEDPECWKFVLLFCSDGSMVEEVFVS